MLPKKQNSERTLAQTLKQAIAGAIGAHLAYLVIFYLSLALSCNRPSPRISSSSPRPSSETHKCPTQLAKQSPAVQLSLAAPAATPHQLPWTVGKRFRITQGHLASTHTEKHTRPKETYAWDLGMASGEPLTAAADGTIRRIQSGFGVGACDPNKGNSSNLIVLYWNDGSGRESLYLHLSRLESGIVPGVQVKRGQLIGYSGASGYVCGKNGSIGAHLHYQVQKGATSANDRTTSWYLNSVYAPFSGFTDAEQINGSILTAKRIEDNALASAPTPSTGEPTQSNETEAGTGNTGSFGSDPTSDATMSMDEESVTCK